MIRKLQRKFIMIAMLSLTLVMVLLVGSMNAINFYQMNDRLNGAIQILTDNQGQFPKYERGKPHGGDKKFGFEMNPETPFEIRYFTVDINGNGSIREIDTSHIAALTSSDAEDYANKVMNGSRTHGFMGIYKYAVVKQAYGSMVIFVDSRGELQTTASFLLVSCLVALSTLLLVFLLVSILSRKAMKPIIENMEKQKQFITDAGHEIKTPLAIISANADVLELTGGESEWITSIRNQISRLDKLVKNLLTLSKIEEGNIELVFTKFDVSKEVFVIARPFKTMAENQNKKFTMNIQPDVMLNGDVNSIHQLVSTLVDNAIKYSNDGGEIGISLNALKKGIKLEVYNTVDTIDKSSLDRLFDRFYRADESRSRETGGYGIGLSIAKSIVDAHHGRITARSEDGRSVRFTVIL